MNASSIVIATTTFASKQDASEMAKRILASGLAACVQVEGPLESHYRWKGELAIDEEWRMSIKTVAGSLAGLSELVHKHHPYDLPQWIVVESKQVSDAYGDWVRTSLSTAPIDQVLKSFHVHLVAKDGDHLGIKFDDACQRLDRVPRLHLELDGSFVWVGEDWQMDGMLYDRNDLLRYVDLKGCCPKQIWADLVSILADPSCVPQIISLPGGGLYDLQSFETLTWS
jgi:periplasmic divalent cation tolerance protein